MNPDDEKTLSDRIEKLEAKADAAGRASVRRFDPTEGMSMPKAALAEMAKAVGDNTLSDIVRDRARSNPNGPASPGAPVARGSGHYQPRSLADDAASRSGAHWPKPRGVR